MLDKELEATLNDAFRQARARRHEFMTVEHLLLALLDNPAALNVLKNVEADVDKIRSELTEYIYSTTP
jgi:ATP-dependent Clp protease ATP-binding subunit ClpA